MTTSIDHPDTETLGSVSARYASALRTAVIQAGAPGRITAAHHQEGSLAANEGPHAAWSFVHLHMHRNDVHV